MSRAVHPSVSVVIPVYNRQDTIARAVLSVTAQTCKPQEVLVVDDGSTDNTLAELAALGDVAGLRVISTDGRCGANTARNIGAREAAHKWIAFQDSDDAWFPDKLEQQFALVQASDANAVFCPLVRVDGQRASMIPPAEYMKPIKRAAPEALDAAMLRRLLTRNLVSTQTLLVKKAVFDTVGGFDESLPRFQDWDLAIRLAQHGKLHLCDEPLVIAFLQSDSITRNYGAGVRAREHFLQKYATLYQASPRAHAHARWSLTLRHLRVGAVGAAVSEALRACKAGLSGRRAGL